jgi:hypothetical protein
VTGSDRIALALELGGWGSIVVGIVALAAGVATFLGNAENAQPGQVPIMRGLFLVGLALAAVFTVLAALGGFHDEDVVFIAVCWVIVGLSWLAQRHVANVVRRRRDA